MKKPEEIKRGMKQDCGECDGENFCPYIGIAGCIGILHKDARALIRRLERDKAWASENYELIREENKRLEAQVPKWISVEERLPEKSGRYLVCTSKSSVYYAKFTRHEQDGRFHTDINTHITHWMPMPEPPKEGSNA